MSRDYDEWRRTYLRSRRDRGRGRGEAEAEREKGFSL